MTLSLSEQIIRPLFFDILKHRYIGHNYVLTQLRRCSSIIRSSFDKFGTQIEVAVHIKELQYARSSEDTINEIFKLIKTGTYIQYLSIRVKICQQIKGVKIGILIFLYRIVK